MLAEDPFVKAVGEHSRFLVVYQDGIVACQTDQFFYNDTLCNLQKEVMLTDSLFFAIEDQLYASKVRTHIAPGIMQVEPLQASRSISFRDEDFNDDPEVLELDFSSRISHLVDSFI